MGCPKLYEKASNSNEYKIRCCILLYCTVYYKQKPTSVNDIKQDRKTIAYKCFGGESLHILNVSVSKCPYYGKLFCLRSGNERVTEIEMIESAPISLQLDCKY